MNQNLNSAFIFAISLALANLLCAQQIDFDRANIGIRIDQPGLIELWEPGRNQLAASESAAILKTDPELEALMEKAERFRKEQQFGIATKLWQSVLERSGDALYSTDGEIFFSLAQQVEAVLATLPSKQGLDAYRISADANAKAIMAEAGDPLNENALRKVVRLYFLSSIGDDAALTLSSIYMDQFDFVGAYRMLSKIQDVYPDPSVSMVDVNVRMALCQAMMGEEDNAVAAINRAKTLANGVANRNLEAVERSIPELVLQGAASSVDLEFAMALSNRSRKGTMPALPSVYLDNDLKSVWQYYFLPKTLIWSDLKNIKPFVGDGLQKEIKDSIKGDEKALIEKWRRLRWRPAGDLVFEGDRVFFKTAVDLSVWNRNAKDDEVIWRPLWRNKFEMDDMTLSLVQAQSSLRRGGRSREVQGLADMPSKSYEVQLFADRVSSQLAIQDGILYTIEGGRFDDRHVSYQNRRNLRYSGHFRRGRSNHLTAYDAGSGKLLWTLPESIESESETSADEPFGSPEKPASIEDVPLMVDDSAETNTHITSGGFMSTPVFYGGLLVVPVNHGGAIWIYGLDPKENGKTVWRSYLCDEPNTGANPNAPINLSIDGSDLFASCGLGVVFILDPTTGLIRFAKPYERDGQAQVTVRNRWRSGGLNRKRFGSWNSDTIVPYGRQMICLSSDAKYIQALDRNTGAMIWSGERHPLEAKVDYLIGVHDNILYAGGRETILAFNLAEEGRMVWGGRKLFDGGVSYGRGMVTPDGVFVPVEDSIQLFSLNGENGKAVKLKTLKVELGTGAPVGNLYSDGDRIWVHGANRVYALAPRN